MSGTFLLEALGGGGDQKGMSKARFIATGREHLGGRNLRPPSLWRMLKARSAGKEKRLD